MIEARKKFAERHGGSVVYNEYKRRVEEIVHDDFLSGNIVAIEKMEAVDAEIRDNAILSDDERRKLLGEIEFHAGWYLERKYIKEEIENKKDEE
jgi:hypothetical protein